MKKSEYFVTGITWMGSDIPKDEIEVHLEKLKNGENIKELTIRIPKMLLKPLGIIEPKNLHEDEKPVK